MKKPNKSKKRVVKVQLYKKEGGGATMIKPVKKQDEFTKIMTTSVKDISYILHSLIGLIRKLNREGKINDEEFYMLHQDVELLLNRKSSTLTPTK